MDDVAIDERSNAPASKGARIRKDVGITDEDWAAERERGRYIESTTVFVLCLDCGSSVHRSLMWKHDEMHPEEALLEEKAVDAPLPVR